MWLITYISPHSWFPVHTTSMNGTNKGYASYLMEQHMNNGALLGKVFPECVVIWLCGVIIVDCCRVHLWQYFLKVILEMCLLSLLVHDVLILVPPVIMRQMLVMKRLCVCACMCVCMCPAYPEWGTWCYQGRQIREKLYDHAYMTADVLFGFSVYHISDKHLFFIHLPRHNCV